MLHAIKSRSSSWRESLLTEVCFEYAHIALCLFVYPGFPPPAAALSPSESEREDNSSHVVPLKVEQVITLSLKIWRSLHRVMRNSAGHHHHESILQKGDKLSVLFVLGLSEYVSFSNVVLCCRYWLRDKTKTTYFPCLKVGLSAWNRMVHQIIMSQLTCSKCRLMGNWPRYHLVLGK